MNNSLFYFFPTLFFENDNCLVSSMLLSAMASEGFGGPGEKICKYYEDLECCFLLCFLKARDDLIIFPH